MSSRTTREIVLAQAALEHGIYFLELGSEKRAAAYFQFASKKLQTISQTLITEDPPSLN
jgi:hypothetical protein